MASDGMVTGGKDNWFPGSGLRGELGPIVRRFCPEDARTGLDRGADRRDRVSLVRDVPLSVIVTVWGTRHQGGNRDDPDRHWDCSGPGRKWHSRFAGTTGWERHRFVSPVARASR